MDQNKVMVDDRNKSLENFYKSGAVDLSKRIQEAIIKQAGTVVYTPKDKRGI